MVETDLHGSGVFRGSCGGEVKAKSCCAMSRTENLVRLVDNLTHRTHLRGGAGSPRFVSRGLDGRSRRRRGRGADRPRGARSAAAAGARIVRGVWIAPVQSAALSRPAGPPLAPPHPTPPRRPRGAPSRRIWRRAVAARRARAKNGFDEFLGLSSRRRRAPRRVEGGSWRSALTRFCRAVGGGAAAISQEGAHPLPSLRAKPTGPAPAPPPPPTAPRRPRGAAVPEPALATRHVLLPPSRRRDPRRVRRDRAPATTRDAAASLRPRRDCGLRVGPDTRRPAHETP